MKRYFKIFLICLFYSFNLHAIQYAVEMKVAGDDAFELCSAVGVGDLFEPYLELPTNYVYGKENLVAMQGVGEEKEFSGLKHFDIYKGTVEVDDEFLLLNISNFSKDLSEKSDDGFSKVSASLALISLSMDGFSNLTSRKNYKDFTVNVLLRSEQSRKQRFVPVCTSTVFFDQQTGQFDAGIFNLARADPSQNSGIFDRTRTKFLALRSTVIPPRIAYIHENKQFQSSLSVGSEPNPKIMVELELLFKLCATPKAPDANY